MNNFYNNKTIITALLIFLTSSLLAQLPNTLVKGKIKNNLARHIELQVNQKYLNDAVDFYKSNILEDGTFMFAVEINEPQVAKIIYARNEALIYLEPHDTLVIEGESNSFQYSMEFSGRGGINNSIYQKHLKNNPPILNAWQLTQYQKGIFWFANEQKMDVKMQQLKEEPFTQFIADTRNMAMSNLLQFQNEASSAASEDFIEFLETEIYYHWAYHMLLYGSVYQHMHQLDPKTYFKFLDEIVIHDKSLGSYWYRNFLLAYLNHKFIALNQEGDEYANQYQLANKLLQSKQLAFVQAHLLYKGFYAKRSDAILASYIDFIDKNPYPIFDEKVIGAYQKAMRYAVGAPAPDFSIRDLDDNQVSLLDYQGKVVMLNFWASWCRPCISKMNQLDFMQQELEGKDIVFVNISLDRDDTSWKNAIRANDFKGVHLIAENALESNISQSYEVKALPQYFIIDKRGNFAEKPSSKDINDLKLTLEYLNRRK